MYYKVNVQQEQEESVEIKVKAGILGSAEWGTEENKQLIPKQIINVLVSESEDNAEAWVQIIDSNYNIVSEGVISNDQKLLHNKKETAAKFSGTLNLLIEKDVPSCLQKSIGIKRKCCTGYGRRPNGSSCYVRCCNSCCSGGSACSASCCAQ